MDQGLMQRDVAQRIGADTGTVINWETNKASPGLQYVPAILRFLGWRELPAQSANRPSGERLRAYRRSLGLSQAEMSKRLGIDASTLSRWERDRAISNRVRAARVLSRLLGIIR